jgi:hypothetical protein
MTTLPKLEQNAKRKLTDAERHRRFVETAKKVEASDGVAEFDDAFTKVVSSKKRLTDPSQSDGKEDDRTGRNQERR